MSIICDDNYPAEIHEKSFMHNGSYMLFQAELTIVFLSPPFQVWCERITVNGLLSQILTDPHSPGKFRVFGPLSNSEDFVREWQCPLGPMNREEKCLLW